MFLQIFLLTFVCALIMFAYGIIAVKTSSKAIITNRLVEETKLVGTLLNDADDFEKFSDYHSGGNAYRITVIGTKRRKVEFEFKLIYASEKFSVGRRIVIYADGFSVCGKSHKRHDARLTASGKFHSR